MKETPLAMTVSISRKVQLGNYESADVFMCVSGLTPETTQEEIDTLLDNQGALAYRAIRDRMKEKLGTFHDAEWEAMKTRESA